MTDIDISIEKLTTMKNKVEKAESEHLEAKGEKKAILDGLNSDFKIKNSKELSLKIDSLINELEELEDDFKKGVEELENDYDWSENNE